MPVSGSEPGGPQFALGTAVEPMSSKKNVSADATAGTGARRDPRGQPIPSGPRSPHLAGHFLAASARSASRSPPLQCGLNHGKASNAYSSSHTNRPTPQNCQTARERYGEIRRVGRIPTLSLVRIATFNVNGIRAAQRRGFEDWLGDRGPDVVALQEVRARAESIPPGVFGDYHLTYDEGDVAGRNGVAVLTRQAPVAVRTWSGTALMRAPGEMHTDSVELDPEPLARGLGEFANQGRYVEVDLAEAPITVASMYLPKGGLPAHLQKPGRMREAPDGGAATTARCASSPRLRDS